MRGGLSVHRAAHAAALLNPYPMKLFPHRWKVVYEIPSQDQDRAADYAKTVGQKVEPANLPEFHASVQRLFGRAFLVNRKTGARSAVRVFDDLAPPAS